MKRYLYISAVFLLALLLYQQLGSRRSILVGPESGLRLVSLSPTLTETLFELGAGGQIVGVTDYCVYPPEAKKKTRIGDFVNPSFERILSLHPSLVFAERWSSTKIVSQLQNAGLRVVEIDSPKSISQIYQCILQTAKPLGRETRAQDIVEDMKQRTEHIRLKSQTMRWHPSIYVEIDRPTWTVGRSSYTSEALELCGGRNIFGDLHRSASQVSQESIIVRNPDIILTFDAPAEDYENRPGWNRIAAVRSKRVIDDVGRNLLSHGNHRLVVGMEQLQARLLAIQ